MAERPSDPLDDLRWRDELLQILYWMRGEGLGVAVTADAVRPLLPPDAGDIEAHLARLVADDLAERLPHDPSRYRLTARGVDEGGRRFADAFEGLTGGAHGECSDPRCDCRTKGPQACVSSHDH